MVDVNEIKNYEFISFDIFDTLIKRNCICPRDVFSIVQDTYNSDSKEKIFNFLSNRVNSELQARKLTNNEEIEFDEIYFYLEKYYSAEICKKLKQIEIETELNICQSNNEMNKILQYCIENNKKIILTSDMYLDKSIIEKILDKNNIKYHKLFLSSDFKVKKGSGNLFLKILDDLNIDKSKLIHIGDNYKSDYLIPKQLGIASIHYVKKSNNSYYNNIIKNNLSSNVLSSFITNNLKDNEKKLYDWGYICFGPVLYGFTKWLIKNLKKENINKVYFLARDGYIMKKAFDAINTNTDIKSYYFYASRRSIIVPSLWCCKKINEIYDLMYGVNRLSLDKFIKRLGLEDFDLSKEIKKFKLNLKHVYSIEYMKTNQDFCNFMNEIYDKIINNSKKEYFYMEKYLQNVDFKGKVAIVDIGWCGNMQMALSKVVGNEIHGYYVGIKKNQSKLKMKGFLFDNEHDKNIYSNIDRNAGIFEFPFLAKHGSVRCFNDSKEMVEFYDYEYKNSYGQDLLINIQDGAMDFVKNINESKCNNYIKFNAEICSNNLLLSLDKPNKAMLETFGNLKFLDFEVMDVANAKKLSYYVFHPKSFFRDFKKSKWKMGFLNKIIYLKNVNYLLGILLWKLIKKIKN